MYTFVHQDQGDHRKRWDTQMPTITDMFVVQTDTAKLYFNKRISIDCTNRLYVGETKLVNYSLTLLNNYKL